MTYKTLSAARVIETLMRLSDRIQERFPGSGLGETCSTVRDIATHAERRSRWIQRPIMPLRIVTWVLIATIFGTLVATALSVPNDEAKLDFIALVQLLEAGINDAVLIGAGIFFLVSLETRIKRRRVLAALDELRSLAHIIDMLQLTKDPERLLRPEHGTKSSPKRTMTAFELGRYLDYSSELLALIGKIAALYAQALGDSAAHAAVNEIEDLTTGLSRKIWQKIVVLSAQLPAPSGPSASSE